MNLRINVSHYIGNNLSIHRGFNMLMHKRGSTDLECVMSLGAGVSDGSIVTHNSCNSFLLVKQ